MPNNELQTAFNEIAELRALSPEVVMEALNSALISAYRRDMSASASQLVEARFDPLTGRAKIFVQKEVVEDVISPATEVTLEKARFYHPEAQLGDLVMVQVEGTTKNFGRIAAQTAKQVILQKIREAERNAVYMEYADREGDIVTASVQSVTPSKVTMVLGRAEAMLPRAQQIPNERFRQHEKVRVYVVEVKKGNRGPEILVSRSHRNMLRRLLEFEVPEIYNGQVEIKSIAREAGYRSKVAVVALQDGIDPVGACVGMKGIRIQNIVKELNDEKIDVIEWSPSPEVFISKALSPARVTGVYLEDDLATGRTATVIVPDDQLSLAIGKEGQNARLAAKLTGWRIDIKSVTETVQGALENLDVPPLSDLPRTHPALVEDVQRAMDKRAAGRAVMPEEFNQMAKFADLVERKLLAMRLDDRRAEQEQMAAVRATLPPAMFNIPISALRLPEQISDALVPLGSAGQVMLLVLLDEDRLRGLLVNTGRDAMDKVQAALAEIMLDESLDVAESLSPELSVEAEVSAEPAPTMPPQAATGLETMDGVNLQQYEPSGEFEEDDDPKDGKKGGKKTKGREIYFDEDRGETLSKRHRKSNRRRGGWGDDY